MWAGSVTDTFAAVKRVVPWLQMPRRPRIQAVQTIYHLTTQSACGTPLYDDDDDRWTFLTIAHSVLERFRWICIAYCLMTTHYRPRSGLSAKADQWKGSGGTGRFPQR